MQQLWETILKSAGLEETQFVESLFLVKLFDVYEGINFLKFCDENSKNLVHILFISISIAQLIQVFICNSFQIKKIYSVFVINGQMQRIGMQM